MTLVQYRFKIWYRDRILWKKKCIVKLTWEIIFLQVLSLIYKYYAFWVLSFVFVQGLFLLWAKSLFWLSFVEVASSFFIISNSFIFQKKKMTIKLE